MTQSKKPGKAAIGIIGGSGLYDIEGLERVREVRVRTPFGAPSDAIRVSAVGSMKESIRPGDVVLPDQFIDLTKRRVSTFFDEGLVAHVGFGEPVCASVADVLEQAGRSVGAGGGGRR